MNWHKSSYSGSHNANCVEVAEGSVTLVRDTQNRNAVQLSFTAEGWIAFITSLKREEPS
jgi:hypothetical protein